MTPTQFQTVVEIAAMPEQVWPVMADVEKWPEWTASVTRVKLLTPGPLTTSASVKQAMVHDWGSRDQGFIAINKMVLTRIVELAREVDVEQRRKIPQQRLARAENVIGTHRPSFADVLGGERDPLRREVVGLDEVAHRLADAGAQAVLVRAAGARRDAVDVATDLLVGRLGPLHRQVDAETVVLPEHERRLVDRPDARRREQLLQVGFDAVGVLERLARLRRLVLEDDFHALVEIARHLEALADERGVELHLREDRGVGFTR